MSETIRLLEADEEIRLARAIEAGASAFLAKPFDEDDTCFHDHEQAAQGLPVRDGSQAR